ncbi:regulator of g protein signaling-related [Anaeramoeba flamelloides]|uniref:Regulator of g protein signaling-related n=1 Tax=Anaeramoeba flamelloides TaxID=1746091 RepID=A0AAV7Y8M7_9EUKA|nr:regulator of g protein signaling-related [Anaeramoeba flamelloides]
MNVEHTDNNNNEILDFDNKAKEVERKFFQNKSRISEKFISKTLTFQFIFYHLLFAIIYYGIGIKNDKKCEDFLFNWGSVLILVIVYLNVIILMVLAYLIRNIQENYKIRNEIFFTLILIILLIFFIWLPELSNKINYHYRWAFLIFVFLQITVTNCYPLYWTYRFENNEKKIQLNKNNKNNNKNNNNNNNYKKFFNIINHPEKVKYWISYAKKNYSFENIIFYKTHQSFKNLCESKKKNRKKKKKQIQKLIKELLNNFIIKNSPLTINISSNSREKTIQNCNKYLNNIELLDDHSQVFSEALDEIICLMYYDTFPQFIQSQTYLEMVIKIEQINPDQFLDEKIINKKNIDDDKFATDDDDENEKNEEEEDDANSNSMNSNYDKDDDDDGDDNEDDRLKNSNNNININSNNSDIEIDTLQSNSITSSSSCKN